MNEETLCAEMKSRLRVYRFTKAMTVFSIVMAIFFLPWNLYQSWEAADLGQDSGVLLHAAVAAIWGALLYRWVNQNKEMSDSIYTVKSVKKDFEAASDEAKREFMLSIVENRCQLLGVTVDPSKVEVPHREEK